MKIKSFLYDKGIGIILGGILLFSFFQIIVKILDVQIFTPVPVIVSFLSVLLWTVTGTRSIRKQYRWGIVIGLICVFTVISILFTSLFTDGFGIWGNGFKDIIGLRFGRIFLPFAISGDYSTVLSGTCFGCLLLLFFGILISYGITHRSSVFLFLPVLILLVIACLYQEKPTFVETGLFIASFICALIYISGDNYGIPLISATLIFVVCVICTSLPLLTGITWEQPELLRNIRTSVVDWIDDIRYGSDTVGDLPQGDLTHLDAYEPSDDVALKIKMDDPQSLYLRGYIGTVYSDKGWSSLDSVRKYQSADLFYYLHNDGFYGYDQTAVAANVLDVLPDVQNIQIQRINTGTKYAYAPYEYIEDCGEDARYYVGDENPVSSLLTTDDGLHYRISGNIVRYSNTLQKILGDSLVNPDDKVSIYLRDESAYRSYVYETACDLPEETREYLSTRLKKLSDDEYGHPDIKYVIQVILDILLNDITYDENSVFSGEDDFLTSFLETNCTGYSVHYATAAVLMFRYYGIPSRYVEGYVVTPEDVAGYGSDDYIEIPGSNSHAWAEYYLDGIGWVPLETTPKYLYTMEQPDYLSDVISDNVEVQSNQDGLTELTEDNFEEDEEKDLSSEDESLSPVAIIGIVTGGILLLCIAVIILLLIRHYKVMEKRIRSFHRGNPSECVDRIFADTLRILNSGKISIKNGSLDQYYRILRENNKNELAKSYSLLLSLQQEALFSNHAITEDRLKSFLLYREMVTKEIRKSTPIIRRIWNRYVKNIY